MFSGILPTQPWARTLLNIRLPQPGQKAAVSGICAPQCGHDRNGACAWSMAGNISNYGQHHNPEEPSNALTQGSAKSMFRANFGGGWPPDARSGGQLSAFCNICGNAIGDTDKFCRICGARAAAEPGSMAATAVPQGTSTKAILSLITGLFFFFFPLSIVAVILGHLSLSEVRKSAGRLKGEGIAKAGLVLGYAGITAIPIFLILAAIAIPNFLRARM